MKWKDLMQAIKDYRHPNTYELKPYPNVDHGTGLGIGMGCEGWFERAVAFWQNQ